MSRVQELKESGLEKLPSILEEYEKELASVEEILVIKGKKLEHANRENPTWHHYFDQKRIELATLSKYFEAQVNKTRGMLFKNLTMTSSIDLSDRAKDKYIDNEKQYLDMYELYLEVDEMHKKYQAVVDAFTTRGYALNNITKIRVASLEDAVI